MRPTFLLSEDTRDETAAPPSLDSKVNVFGLVKQGKVGVSRCSVAPIFPAGASGPANCRSIACIELQLAASRAWYWSKPNRATTEPLRDSRELGSSETEWQVISIVHAKRASPFAEAATPSFSACPIGETSRPLGQRTG